jgi:hypothetical protein
MYIGIFVDIFRIRAITFENNLFLHNHDLKILSSIICGTNSNLEYLNLKGIYC